MERLFNIAGPCVPEEHYMLPPERRMGEALELIRLRRWFALVSGRQTGKTTVVQWLAKSLSAKGDHLALWIDLETARDRPDPALAMPIVIDAIRDGLARSPSPELMPDAAADWQGECYVFDKRIAIDPTRQQPTGTTAEDVFTDPADHWRLARARRLDP
jgi:hypothetical protein